MNARLETMSQIIAEGEQEAMGGQVPELDPETAELAGRKRWTLDDPPDAPVDPLR